MDRQKRKDRKAAIGVEAMEGRVALSTATSMIAPLHGSLVQGVNYLYLQGSATGVANRVVGNPDVNTAVMVHGTAHLATQGTMQVTGYFHGTGFIAHENLDGTLKLYTGKGSVTLQLQGPSVAGSTAPTSGTYQYSVQKGTGSHARDIGGGTVDVVLGPKSFSLAFHGRPNNA